MVINSHASVFQNWFFTPLSNLQAQFSARRPWRPSLKAGCRRNEVDFILKKGPKVKQLIQVTYATGKEEVNERENKSLLKASKELRCKNLFVITWDFSGKEKIGGKEVTFIPLWSWLLQNERL